MVSRSPSQSAIAACGSIGLWCSMGMRYSASTFTGAAASASRGVPRTRGGGPCEGTRALERLGDDERDGLLIEEDAIRLERQKRLVLFAHVARRGVLGRRLRPELRRVEVRKDADHPRSLLGLARVDRRDAPLGDR